MASTIFSSTRCKKGDLHGHVQGKVEPQLPRVSACEPSIDPSLFQAYRAGDHQAMRAIVGIFHKRLIGFIRLYTRNRELAEEAAQEVFLAAYLQRDSVRSPEGLRPWLFTVAKRKALRATEKAARSREVCDENDGFLEYLVPIQGGQGDNILIDQLGAHLQAALRKLAPRDREILILRYFGNLQVKEIAEVLNIPMGSVGVFLNRILAKVRKLLEEQGIQPEDVLGK
jgi:RNA polymerase sigma-70 factor (ECF subfamily)